MSRKPVLPLILSCWMVISFGCHRSKPAEFTPFFAAFYNRALTDQDVAWQQLSDLCRRYPRRLCGSEAAQGAVQYTLELMRRMDLDRAYLQEVMVKHWQRQPVEQALLQGARSQDRTIPICSLGGSVGTGPEGIRGKILEVEGLAELEQLSPPQVAGRVVFFNQAMNPTRLNTFRAYGEAVPQRIDGASAAGRRGAVAVLVRSVTNALDDFPHTGVMHYQSGVPRIPAVAISTLEAERLSRRLSSGEEVSIRFTTRCIQHPEKISHNVIGEITGSRYPDQIITVGGHLDCWDNSPGAHDDGGGCIQAIQVLSLFKACGIRPRHTLRAVMFMDEEVAQRGGLAYAREALGNGERHVAALESDRGVFTPRALGVSDGKIGFNRVKKYQHLFTPYHIAIIPGGGGVDIGPLKNGFPKITLMSLIPDDARYFDFHHSAADTPDQVHPREMQLGTAAMACLVYLVDRLAD